MQSSTKPFLTSQVSLWIAAGDQAREKCDWISAAQAYRHALDADPALAAIWVQYGHSLKEQGLLVEAERAYRRSLAIDAHSADTHLQLGHVLKLLHRPSEAIDAYLNALTKKPRLLDAWDELFELGLRSSTIRQILTDLGVSATEFPNSNVEIQRSVAVDASDLFFHFINHGPIVTGIQRVQERLIAGLHDCTTHNEAPAILCYVPTRREWIEIPRPLYLVLASTHSDSEKHSQYLEELRFCLVANQSYVFQPASELLNLGTSWWLPNYLLTVRTAQRQSGLRFYHFIHDVIPAILPKFCNPRLVQDFLPWIIELLGCANGIVVNSEATKCDLEWISETTGVDLPPMCIVKLDAAHIERADIGSEPSRSLADMGITRDFVLFVSTFEARKNHKLAIDAWRHLAATRDENNIPQLVCVGQPGWLTAASELVLDLDNELTGAVRLLHDVTDLELATLYRNCLFTIYPSAYEGWGLPVSEALFYGKVPLVARTSSLPEAGGFFAEYFDLGDSGSFQKQLQRLLDNPAHVERRARIISANYRPRRWGEIAEQLVEALRCWRHSPAKHRGPALPTGCYIPMARNQQEGLTDLRWSGIGVRIGDCWGQPDELGCVIAGDRAELQFEIECPRCELYVIIENLADKAVSVCLASSGAEGWSGVLAPRELECAQQKVSGPIVQLQITASALTGYQVSRSCLVRVVGFCIFNEADHAAEAISHALMIDGPEILIDYTRRMSEQGWSERPRNKAVNGLGN